MDRVFSLVIDKIFGVWCSRRNQNVDSESHQLSLQLMPKLWRNLISVVRNIQSWGKCFLSKSFCGYNLNSYWHCCFWAIGTVDNSFHHFMFDFFQFYWQIWINWSLWFFICLRFLSPVEIKQMELRYLNLFYYKNNIMLLKISY